MTRNYEHMSPAEQIRSGLHDAIAHAHGEIALKATKLHTASLEDYQLTEPLDCRFKPVNGNGSNLGSGIYFWIMWIGSVGYKIYLGRTNSLPRRTKEHLSDFQVYSPHDYKLSAFRDYITEIKPNARFELYFRLAKQPKKAEAAAIKHFAPLLNKRLPATSEMKKQLREAFTKYYQQAFMLKLGDRTTRRRAG
jgi:hypothetical protein